MNASIPQTVNTSLIHIGYGGQLVAHGLHSIGCTIMKEAEFNSDKIDLVLTHNEKMKLDISIIVLLTLSSSRN